MFGAFGFSRAIDLARRRRSPLGRKRAARPDTRRSESGPERFSTTAPSPTLHTLRVGPNIEGGIDGGEEQTTLAADGPNSFSVWAGNQDSRTVSEIDTSLERIVLTIRGITPGGLAAVGNSNGDTVWASDPARGLVLRIDGNARRVVRRIAVPGRPTRLAATDQAVWVIGRGSGGSLWRIDPRTNAVVARIPLGLIPQRVVLGAGSVWVTGNRQSNGHGRERGGVGAPHRSQDQPHRRQNPPRRRRRGRDRRQSRTRVGGRAAVGVTIRSTQSDTVRVSSP